MPSLTRAHDVGAAAGELVADACEAAVRHHGVAVLAVPGGGTPAPVFRWLVRNVDAQLHDRLVVTFVDERHLPMTAETPWGQLPPESNLRGAWDAWFQHRMPRVIPLARPGTAADAADAANAELAPLGGVDVVLLGFGPDGHVASLFPDHPALRAEGPVVVVPDSPKPPPVRLTMTLSWLRTASITVVVGAGADKAPIAAAAWHQAMSTEANLPLAMARPRHRWAWVLDPAAASHLAIPE